MEYTSYTADDIAWIGSLQLGGLYGLSIPSAVVNDKLGPQVSILNQGREQILACLLMTSLNST